MTTPPDTLAAAAQAWNEGYDVGFRQGVDARRILREPPVWPILVLGLMLFSAGFAVGYLAPSVFH